MDIDEQLPAWNEVVRNALYALEDIRSQLDAAEGFLDFGWRADSPQGQDADSYRQELRTLFKRMRQLNGEAVSVLHATRGKARVDPDLLPRDEVQECARRLLELHTSIVAQGHQIREIFGKPGTESERAEVQTAMTALQREKTGEQSRLAGMLGLDYIEILVDERQVSAAPSWQLDNADAPVVIYPRRVD